MDEYDVVFEPTRDPATAIENEGYEPVNVCRVAALGATFGVERPLAGLDDELQAIGLPRSLARMNEWSWDRAFQEAENGDSLLNARPRDVTFADLGSVAHPTGAATFLTQVLCSGLERESAAAAGAIFGAAALGNASHDPRQRHLPSHLWDEFWLFGSPVWWDLDPRGMYGPDDDAVPIGVPRWWRRHWVRFSRNFISAPAQYPGNLKHRAEILASLRLSLAARSQDPITRQFAMAARANFEGDSVEGPEDTGGNTPAPGAVTASVLVHGTWGWKGDWWRPGTSFHTYARDEIRRNLYSRGAPFSWSGSYSDRERRMAAEDFTRWADEISPRGIDTLFAHSYGGEVAARAWHLGTKIQELVLLSAPATHHIHHAVTLGLKTVDIRLPFDPVLALARTPQRIPCRTPKLTEVILPRWQLSHGATHDPHVWQTEELPKRARL